MLKNALSERINIMGKTAWIITAFALIAFGMLVLIIALSSVGWDFSKLGTGNYETNSYEITEDFENILIETNTADVAIVPSYDGKCSVVCYEQSKVRHSVLVRDGALTVSVEDTRKWYEYIGFNFTKPTITLYIPAGDYATLSIESDTGDVEIPKELSFKSIYVNESTGDVKNYASASEKIKIDTSTGDIRVEGISAGSLELSVSTGKVTASDIICDKDFKVDVNTGRANLTNVTCKNLISDGDTGDIFLKNVIASERFYIERDTGDVKLDGSDAAEIFIETDTGDVTGTLLSEKIFIVETDTGRRDVPKSTTGGRCEITTDTGDIRISITEK